MTRLSASEATAPPASSAAPGARARAWGRAGFGHSRSSSSRSTCATTVPCEAEREAGHLLHRRQHALRQAGKTEEDAERERGGKRAGHAAQRGLGGSHRRGRAQAGSWTTLPPAGAAGRPGSLLATATMRGVRRAAATMRSAIAASCASVGSGARSSARSSASASASRRRAARSRATRWPALGARLNRPARPVAAIYVQQPLELGDRHGIARIAHLGTCLVYSLIPHFRA